MTLLLVAHQPNNQKETEMKIESVIKWSLGAVLLTSLVGCSTKNRAQTAQVATEGAAAVAEMTGPNQAEILDIVTRVNNSEIETAQLAKTTSKNPRVLEFADQMIKEHTAMNKQVVDLARRLNLKLEANAISQSLQTGTKATMSSLKDLKGTEFNKAYIAQQVNMHQTALETISDNLIPNAKSEDLKSMLEKAQAAVDSHLKSAQKIQNHLNKTQ